MKETPIATARTTGGRLCLLVDCGPESGVYAVFGPGPARLDDTWIAMRADVALKMIDLGRCGFRAGTARRFEPDPAVIHDPRRKPAIRQRWRRV